MELTANGNFIGIAIKIALSMSLSEPEIEGFLATISSRIEQFWNVKAILQTVADEIRYQIKCDRLLVCRFEPDWSCTVIVEAIGEPYLSVLGKVIDNSYFEPTWIEKYQRGVTCDDNIIGVKTDESHRELLQYFGVQAHLVIPILQPNTKDGSTILSDGERDVNEQIENNPASQKTLWGLLIAHQWNRLDLHFEDELKAQQSEQLDLPKQNVTQNARVWGFSIPKRKKSALTRQVRVLPNENKISPNPEERSSGQSQRDSPQGGIESSVNESPIQRSQTTSDTEYQQPLKWYDSEIDLLERVADKIAIAVREAKLKESNERELRERREAQEHLQQARQFLQTVIDHLPIAVYVKNARQDNFGRFKLWNKATESIFRLKASEILGQTAFDRFGLKQAGDFLQQDLTVLEKGETLDIEEEYFARSNDEPKIIHKIKVPLYDGERHPQYLLCIAEDITTRKAAERELKLKTAQLAAFSDNLKQLHRLNTTTYQNIEELLKDHIQTGCQMFGSSTGAVGIIEKDIYTIYAIESKLEALYPQMQIPLEDTYCSEVVKQRKTITYHHVGKIKHLGSGLYKNFKFESYIGTPILVDGSIYGTLCFLSEKVKRPDWSDREKETIEMMAQSIGRFISSDRIEQKRQQAEALLTKTKKELEIRVIQRTAQLELTNIRLRDELQERELTQYALRTSQNSLRESERRWRSLLENVRLLVVGVDKEGKVDYVNPYFLELTGYSDNEVMGRDWFDYFVHPQNKDEAQQVYQNLMKFDYWCTHQYHHTMILNKLGEAKIIAWNSTQLRDLQGTPTGIMCIGEDITERQAIEKVKDEFISVVSHELRTPLTSIRGALGLLSTGALKRNPQQAQKVTKIAAQSTEHLVRLVDDILQLERLESGKIKLAIQQIKISGLISQAIERVQIIANKKEINFQAAGIDGIIWGDCDRLIQVLTNLLGNALKFSESRSTVWIDARFERTTDYPPEPMVIFAIRDRGRGIPKNRLESIFERFHQVDASDSRHKGGTGLGLAICRSIVQQHGGKIWVESVYGKGSTFYFSIPINPS